MSEIREIPLEQIRRSPFQPRFELANLSGIDSAEDMLQPILVRQVDDGYELVDGEARLERLKALGATVARCEVRIMDDRQAATAVLRINEERKPLEDVDRAHWLVGYMQRFSTTLTEAAAAGHIDLGTASRLKDLAEIKGWLAHAEGGVGSTNSEEAGVGSMSLVEQWPSKNPITTNKLKLISSLPKEKRSAVVKAMEGSESEVSTSDVRVLVAKVRGGKSPARALTEIENFNDSRRQEKHQDARRMKGKKAAPHLNYALCEECGDQLHFVHVGPGQHRFLRSGVLKGDKV